MVEGIEPADFQRSEENGADLYNIPEEKCYPQLPLYIPFSSEHIYENKCFRHLLDVVKDTKS